MKYCVVIINSVLTLQVSTASLPHDCEPCEIKVVFNHADSLHTCLCARSHRVHIRLSGLINGRNQFHSWGFPQASHSGPSLCRTNVCLCNFFLCHICFCNVCRCNICLSNVFLCNFCLCHVCASEPYVSVTYYVKMSASPMSASLMTAPCWTIK